MPRRNHKKHHKNSQHAEIEHLSMALVLNGKAIEEGPKTKRWSQHDVKHITPITSTQRDMFRLWYEENHICAHGSAGTGKSYISLFLAITAVLERKHQKIIIVRSAVPTRDVGFLPGTLEEKLAQFELPYHDIMHELFGRASTYQDMKDAGLIEFISTSYIRGLTWDNAIVVIDEGENMSFHEIDSIMTRIGKNTRVLFNGDISQTDLDGKRGNVEGMSDAINVFHNMDNFESIAFTVNDIVRSEFVKSWITASEAALAH